MEKPPYPLLIERKPAMCITCGDPGNITRVPACKRHVIHTQDIHSIFNSLFHRRLPRVINRGK